MKSARGLVEEIEEMQQLYNHYYLHYLHSAGTPQPLTRRERVRYWLYADLMRLSRLVEGLASRVL